MEKGKIGVAITTRNRRKAFIRSMQAHLEFKCEEALYIVVNDAGSITGQDDFRFPERVGIPRAKNKCVEILMASGCEHLFLFDDDTFPIAPEWWVPYVESPYKHLCYTFGRPFGTSQGHKHHTLGNGCMMYIHREVVSAIGGFDTAFGLGKYEHTQYSHRAFAAGFCVTPFTDVENSQKLFYAMDERHEVQRSLTSEEMDQLLERNQSRYLATIRDQSFYPYL